jgi:hypothetical protein
MIALRDGMPLISLPDGRSTSFDKRWIIASLLKAASSAGHERWWLSEHIAESLSVYLQRDFDDNCVPVVSLQEAVLDILETLGFSDVAKHFSLPDPPLSLSLADLVRQAGEGYELAFFALLGDRLQCVAVSRVTRLEINDLSDCLKMLGRKKGRNARPSKAGLRDEIVSFIRQHGESVGSIRREEPLEIQLS